MSRAGPSFSSDVLATLASTWGVLVCNVASGIVVARVLGPGQKGLFVLTFLLLNQMVAIGSFGVPHALVYFVAGGRLAPAVALGHLLVLSAGFAAVLAVPYAAIVLLLGPQLFKGVDLRTLPVVGSLLFPVLLFGNAGGVLRGLGRVDLFNWLRLAEAAVGCLFVAAALLVLRGGVRAAVLAASAGETTAGALGVWLALRAVGTRPRWEPGSLWPVVRYGLKSHVALVLQMTERKIDMFLLGYFLPLETAAAQIGLYSVAVALAELPRNIAGAVSTALLPRIAADGPRASRRSVPRVSRHLVAANVACGLAVALLARPLIALVYGPRFLPSVRPLLLLLPGVVMAGVWNVFQAELVGTGRAARPSAFAALTLTLNVALNVAAIPRWGIVGAAVTSGITYSLLAVCLLADYRLRHRDVRLRELVLLSRGDVAEQAARLRRMRIARGVG
jgi:O-antigen/teichoic acid export membrane protein